MEKIYVIQDTESKEYYWKYRAETGFDKNVWEATKYDSVEEAEIDLKDNYLEDDFDGRLIEIK